MIYKKREPAITDSLFNFFCLKDLFCLRSLFCRSSSFFYRCSLCFCWCLSGSCLSSLCSFSLCFCSSLFSFLISYVRGNGVVNLLLRYDILVVSVFLCLFCAFSYCIKTFFLIFFPCVKLRLCCSLVESAFLYSTFEVFHHVYAFALQYVANSIGRLRANFYPVKSTVEIQIYCGWIGIRIECSNLFSKFTITWCINVSDNNSVERITFTTAAL